MTRKRVRAWEAPPVSRSSWEAWPPLGMEELLGRRRHRGSIRALRAWNRRDCRGDHSRGRRRSGGNLLAPGRAELVRGLVRAREVAPRPQPELARLSVGLYYAKPADAARWLASVFGLQSPGPLPDMPDPLPEGKYGHPWIEFRIGNCSLMVLKAGEGCPSPIPPTHETWVFVDDLDDHLARGQASGAKILQGIRQSGYRAYRAEDLEGHRWVFAQARPHQI